MLKQDFPKRNCAITSFTGSLATLPSYCDMSEQHVCVCAGGEGLSGSELRELGTTASILPKGTPRCCCWKGL